MVKLHDDTTFFFFSQVRREGVTENENNWSFEGRKITRGFARNRIKKKNRERKWFSIQIKTKCSLVRSPLSFFFLYTFTIALTLHFRIHLNEKLICFRQAHLKRAENIIMHQRSHISCYQFRSFLLSLFSPPFILFFFFFLLSFF